MTTSITHARAVRCVWRSLLLMSLLAGLVGARGLNAETPPPGQLAECKHDLSGRTQVPASQILTVESKSVTWPDASLGLPEAGQVYAQVQTPGYRYVLEAKAVRYLYTASDIKYRYGGPLALWSYSMLYLQPAATRPNPLFDLYQCSLVGTNHTRIAGGVTAYYPHAGGMVLFTRPALRAGFDLLAIQASTGAKEQRLYSAYAFGPAALNAAGDSWAAFERQMKGRPMQLVVGSVGKETVMTLPLPNGDQLDRIAWADGQLLVAMSEDTRTMYFATDPKAAKPTWQAVDASRFPGALDDVLNKSEMLQVTQTGTAGHPNVEVARVWFTGEKKMQATIEGLTLGGHTLLDPGYVFVWGVQAGEAAAYTVQIRTGEITRGYHGAVQNMQAFKFPLVNKP